MASHTATGQGAPAPPGLDDALAIAQAALAAVHPRRLLPAALRRREAELEIGGERLRLGPPGRVILLAVGKAGDGMAAAALPLLGQRPDAGLVVVPHGSPPADHGLPRVLAGHPLPDAASLGAGDQALALLRGLGPQDRVLLLLSGGASALLEALPPGLDLDDLRSLTHALQRAGADIGELNTVRRALSRVKGGRLARAAAPAEFWTLALSDVPGDAPERIGSGPGVPDPSPRGAAAALLRRRNLDRQASGARALAWLRGGATGERPSSGSLEPSRHHFHLVGSNATARAAAADCAQRLGYRCLSLGEVLRGEARDAGRALASLAGALPPTAGPLCVVAGGETTVQVRGRGRGGRNQELVLAGASTLAARPGWVLLALGSDGCDGSSDAAGAWADGSTCARARGLGLDPAQALEDNDSHGFFAALDQQLRPGPTGTNVADLALLLRPR